jgi:predicted DNA-binding transcriptional regulator AlpA
MSTHAAEVAADVTAEAFRSVDTAPPRRRPAYDPATHIVVPKFLPLVVGTSTTTAWRLRQLGQFPPPIQLTKTRIGWRRADLPSARRRNDDRFMVKDRHSSVERFTTNPIAR